MIRTTPTERHLSRLYFELAAVGAPCEGKKFPWSYAPENLDELLCLAADMSRYDPRLITVLLRFLSRRWPQMNPSSIRKFFQNMKTPQTWGVLSAFLSGRNKDSELKYFCNHLTAGLKPVPLQFYFHHLYPPGGYLADRALTFPLNEYKQWGFLATEAPVIDEQQRTVAGSLDKNTRLNLLQKILGENKQISLSDYLKACRGLLSRQQALLDLRSIREIKLKGRGRGAVWFLPKKSYPASGYG